MLIDSKGVLKIENKVVNVKQVPAIPLFYLKGGVELINNFSNNKAAIVDKLMTKATPLNEDDAIKEYNLMNGRLCEIRSVMLKQISRLESLPVNGLILRNKYKRRF